MFKELFHHLSIVSTPATGYFTFYKSYPRIIFFIFRDYFLLYRMSYIWYTALAVITVLFVGTIVSLITGACQGFEICMSR